MIEPPPPPADVAGYLATLNAEQSAALHNVRSRVHAAVSGLDEKVIYRIPAFTRNGHVVLFAAAWKRHIGMYPIPRFDSLLDDRLEPFRAAKDALHLPYRNPIPDGLIEDLVIASWPAATPLDRCELSSSQLRSRASEVPPRSKSGT